MSVVVPAHLVVGATRTLARSALPDAPVEPDRVRARPRVHELFRALFKPATGTTPAGHTHEADTGRLGRQTNPASC